jgi:hypothetical protein
MDIVIIRDSRACLSTEYWGKNIWVSTLEIASGTELLGFVLGKLQLLLRRLECRNMEVLVSIYFDNCQKQMVQVRRGSLKSNVKNLI